MKSRPISRKQSADALRMARTWRFPIERLYRGGYAYSIGTTHYVLTVGPRKPVFGPASILTTVVETHGRCYLCRDTDGWHLPNCPNYSPPTKG